MQKPSSPLSPAAAESLARTAAAPSAADKSPLGLTVHSVNGPDFSDPKAAAQSRTTLGRMKMALVLLVCAAPVIASYFTFYVIKPQTRTNYGELITPTREMPADLPLQNLQGKAVASRSLHGQWLLLAVGPAACVGSCEQRLLMQRQLREMLGRDRDRLDKVWLVNDAQAIAPALAQVMASGPGTSVLHVESAALAKWLIPAQGQALEDHLYLVDPMGRWMMRWPAQAEPQKVKRDLERLMRANAGWDKAGRPGEAAGKAAASSPNPQR